MSPSLSPSFPLSLKINELNLKKRKTLVTIILKEISKYLNSIKTIHSEMRDILTEIKIIDFHS